MLNTLDRDKRLYQRLVKKYGEAAIISAINEMKRESKRQMLRESKNNSTRIRHNRNFNVILTD